MGRKRTRNHGARAGANARDGGSGHHSHSQSLGDEVQEFRDVEFAAEKRQTERAKRQKVSAEQELASTKRVERALRLKLKKAKTVDLRSACLKELRQAVSKRKALVDVVEGVEIPESGSDDEAGAVDAKTSERILKQAQEQQEEINHEAMRSDPLGSVSAKTMSILNSVGQSDNVRDAINSDDSDDETSGSDEEEDPSSVHSTGELGTDGDATMSGEKNLEFLDGTKVTEEDELALAMFENAGIDDGNDGVMDGDEASKPRGPMIFDFIMDKIKEQEEAIARAAAEAADPERAAREKKIVEVYALVGKILSRYRSGKFPKAFK
eukprot:IDg12153t1